MAFEREFSIGTLPAAAATRAAAKVAPVFSGIHRDTGFGAVADAAPGRVEDPPQADRVTGIVEHPQGDDVTNLPCARRTERHRPPWQECRRE